MTLVEVVVAMAVLFIGMAGVVTAIMMANKTARTTSNQMYAVHEARRQLETLRQLSINSPQLNIGTTTVSGRYSYVVSLQPGVTTNAKRIVMRVPWSNAMLRAVSTAEVTTIFVSAMH